MERIPLPMPRFDRRPLALALLALLVPAPAAADTKAVYQSAAGKESLTFAVKGPMVRWEAPEFTKDKRYALYDGSRGKMILVDDGRKEIMEMDPETMRRQREQMQAQVGPMMEQLREQMKNMPPEQRRRFEQSMGAMMPQAGGAPAITFTTKAVGSGRVNGIPCQRLSVLRNGKAEHELCVATRADAKIPADDYATMLKMFDTMQAMASAVASASMPMTADLKGVPVEMKSHADGTVHTLKSISTDSLPASAFALPPYQKTTFGGLPGMR